MMETLLRWQLQFSVWRNRWIEERCKVRGEAARKKRHRAEMKLAVLFPEPKEQSNG